MSRIEPTFGSNDIDTLDTPKNNIERYDECSIRLNAKLASPGRRDVGQLIDFIVTALIFILCLHLTTVFDIYELHSDIIIIFFPSAYFLLSDALPKGQSIGKRVLNISVISKKTGKYCNIWQSFLRNILTPLIGIIDAFFILTKSRRRIGDYLAGTIVINNH